MIPLSALPVPVKSVHLTDHHIEVGIFPGSLAESFNSKLVDLLPQGVQANGGVWIIFVLRYIIIEARGIFVLLQLTFQYRFKFRIQCSAQIFIKRYRIGGFRFLCEYREVMLRLLCCIFRSLDLFVLIKFVCHDFTTLLLFILAYLRLF